MMSALFVACWWMVLSASCLLGAVTMLRAHALGDTRNGRLLPPYVTQVLMLGGMAVWAVLMGLAGHAVPLVMVAVTYARCAYLIVKPIRVYDRT